MRRLGWLAVAAALAGGAALYVVSAEPAWYLRIRYPLRYEAIVRGHSRTYRLDPALVAAVVYQESRFRAGARSSSGAVGLMQLLPGTAEGIALRTGGTAFAWTTCSTPRSTSATAAGTSVTCSTSTATRGRRSPPTTPGRTTSIAGGRAVSASSSPRRVPTYAGSRG